MRVFPVLVLILAGGALSWIAWRTPEPSYEPVRLEEAPPAPRVPLVVTRAAAPGEVLRELEVEGMCCSGCTAKLYERLAALPEVRAAAVDFQRGVAEALVPADLPLERLVERLSFDKYRARPR